jgi:transcriptional regulator with XRE-family HTH domain
MSALNTARLRLARERKGLTQLELSRLLGVSDGLAGQWERGQKEPSLSKLKDLARALEVRVDWLLDLDEPTEDEGALRLHGMTPQTAAQKARRSNYDGPAAVLNDFQATAGLRDLAQSRELVDALKLDAAEWAGLGSLEYADGLTLNGYCGLLVLLRTASITARRREMAARPGRPVGKHLR